MIFMGRMIVKKRVNMVTRRKILSYRIYLVIYFEFGFWKENWKILYHGFDFGY